MVILEGPSLCITEDKSKGEVDFENCWLVSKNAFQLFSEVGWVDRRQAKIIPILKSVVATKPGTNLWPVLSVHLGNVFFATGNKVDDRCEYERCKVRGCGMFRHKYHK